ncbi:MAG: DUF1467 family protein [Pseudomonadota bacterium]
MSITSGLVLYAVIWAVTFFMVNPFWQRSQAEDGNIVPGTPASAPVDPKLRLKALVTTGVAAVVFAVVFVVIQQQLVTLEDLSWITPPSKREP